MNPRFHFVVFLSVVLLAAAGLSACGDDGGDTDDTGNNAENNAENNGENNGENNEPAGDTFEPVALPILQANSCNDANCHGGDGFLGGGLSLETFEGLQAGGGNEAPTFTPCDATNSSLITKLADPAPFGSQMPLARDPLSPEDIETLTNWVNAGADVTPLCD